MENEQPIGACAIILNSAGQILLGKRKNGYKAGEYGLPGGHVGANELVEQAIAREVLEETGLSGLTFAFLGLVRENQGKYDFIHFVYLAKIENLSPQLMEPDKCEGWEWFDQNNTFENVLRGHYAAIKLFLDKKTLADLPR
jgi:8-oxo-dGTP diphosphatase